jgi:hypothetical protein
MWDGIKKVGKYFADTAQNMKGYDFRIEEHF